MDSDNWRSRNSAASSSSKFGRSSNSNNRNKTQKGRQGRFSGADKAKRKSGRNEGNGRHSRHSTERQERAFKPSAKGPSKRPGESRPLVLNLKPEHTYDANNIPNSLSTLIGKILRCKVVTHANRISTVVTFSLPDKAEGETKGDGLELNPDAPAFVPGANKSSSETGVPACASSETESSEGNIFFGVILYATLELEREVEVKLLGFEKAADKGRLFLNLLWNPVKPKRDQRPLIILDLNGVLVDRTLFKLRRSRGNRNTPHLRPFCAQFIRFCFEYFHVGVW